MTLTVGCLLRTEADDRQPIRLEFIHNPHPTHAFGGVHVRHAGADGRAPSAPSEAGWAALLEAGRREHAARVETISLRVKGDARGPAWASWADLEMDVGKSRLGLQECYRRKFGEDRPAADRSEDWDDLLK